jgi:hypothetical protein
MEQSNEAPEAQPEVSQDPVEIRHEDAITINDALLLAAQISFTIGRSTLQRWAKVWHELGTASQVKCILVTTRAGSIYKLDRQDFEAWVLEQKENDRSHEIPQGLERPIETSSNPTRPPETPRDPVRPQETLRGAEGSYQREVPKNEEHDMLLERVKELEEKNQQLADGNEQLEDENLQLKIDIGVRRELIKQAKEEIDRTRVATNTLLRENGALEFQIRQLAASSKPNEIEAPSYSDQGAGHPSHSSPNGDTPQFGDQRSEEPPSFTQ